MADIFVSYARPNEGLAKKAAEALRAAGFSVWRDDELPAHRAYSDVIEERIKSAKAVLVLWSNEAVKSQWVRAEADAARELGTLVQVSLDGVLPPMPFNQIQCADLFGWTGDTSWPGWAKVESSLGSLAGVTGETAELEPTATPSRRVIVCVLPFVNMSGDAEQEYFSDGISEDIITDLSKVSALTTIGRNTAFALKGKPVVLHDLMREPGATHVLEGSVRKAGSRVRINAQLTECASSHQLWADRYDRDLTDIFAIQDEISKAIVASLKLRLLPKEKKAIEQRGTASPEAYNLYLLARRRWVDGNNEDKRRAEVVVRICRQAIAIDPDYAQAWALTALAQAELQFWNGHAEDGRAAAEKALALNPALAEAHGVKARHLLDAGKAEEANAQLARALELDPESWEVNREAASIMFRQSRLEEAIPFYEKAAELVDTDYHSSSMLMTCYRGVGRTQDLKRIGGLTFARIERALAQDPTSSRALGMGAMALAAIGEAQRTREWIDRALLIDPDNIVQRYNMACSLAAYLHDDDGALELMVPYFEQASRGEVDYAEIDPDMDRIREHPRFRTMVQAARKRLDAG